MITMLAAATLAACGSSSDDHVGSGTDSTVAAITATTVESAPRKKKAKNRHPHGWVKPSERCTASKLSNCDPTTACLIKFNINPDDPGGWDQPHGWIACLKHRGESEEIIRQYQPG